MNIIDVIKRYEIETDEKKVAEYLADFSRSYVDFFYNIRYITSDRKQALAMNRLTTKGDVARYVQSNDDIMERITSLQKSDDPKVRKNIYTTLGHLGASTDVLMRCLLGEDSYMNIYHIMTILLKRDDVYVTELHKVLANVDESDAYYAKIANLLDSVSVAENNEELMLKCIPLSDEILLTAPKVADRVITDDLSALDIDILTSNGEGYIVSSSHSLSDIMRVRSYYELLILPNGIEHVDANAECITNTILEFLSGQYLDTLFATHRKKYAYRLEIRGDISNKDRISLARAIVSHLNIPNIVNIRDRYDVEVRVYVNGNSAMVTLKVPYNDDRFAYRREMLPASIHPVTASIVAGLAKPYIGQHRTVLDGFVGSGTMLYELYMRIGSGDYIGVDIDRGAIDKAHANLDGNIPNIRLVRSDILRYKKNTCADVLISNMPFGTRVLRHDAIEALYKDFFAHLSDILASDGVAFLLTTQGKAIRESVNATCYRIVHEYRVPSGGLLPYLFVIKHK